MQVERIDRRRAYFDQDLVVRGRWLRDLLEPEDVGRAIAALDDGLHSRRAFRKRIRRGARRVVAQGEPQRRQSKRHQHQDDGQDSFS